MRLAAVVGVASTSYAGYKLKDNPFKVPTGIAGGAATLMALISAVKSLRSILRYKKQAKHAEKLHALLQNPEFKKKFNVENWESVKSNRQRAESVAQASAAASMLLGLGLSGGGNMKVEDDATFGLNAKLLAFAALGLPALVKPLVSASMQGKGAAKGLEDEFENAINDAEMEAAVERERQKEANKQAVTEEEDAAAAEDDATV